MSTQTILNDHREKWDGVGPYVAEVASKGHEQRLYNKLREAIAKYSKSYFAECGLDGSIEVIWNNEVESGERVDFQVIYDVDRRKPLGL